MLQCNKTQSINLLPIPGFLSSVLTKTEGPCFNAGHRAQFSALQACWSASLPLRLSRETGLQLTESQVTSLDSRGSMNDAEAV
jgi:hypothetical protein